MSPLQQAIRGSPGVTHPDRGTVPAETSPHCRWLAVGGMYGIISSISGSPDDDDDEKARVSLKIRLPGRELRFHFKDEEPGGTWGSW